MRNINPNSLKSSSLYSPSLDSLIPKDNPERMIADKLPWGELCELGKKAYKSLKHKNKPGLRIIVGLFVWSCVRECTYRRVAENYAFNRLTAYFCGFKTDDFSRSIDHSTLIKFEKNLGEETMLKMKDIIEKMAIDNQPPATKGRHSNDSTVVESDITFPTDTKLMERVRVFLVEDIIKSFGIKKYRTYTRVARKEYLNFAKKRKFQKNDIKKIKKKQLQFLKRNLRQAKEIIDSIKVLGKAEKKSLKKLKKKLEIANRIYTQQLDIFKGKRVKDRVVSFHRPSIRPIFKGKAKRSTEFGLKVSFSFVGGAIILGKYSFDNFFDGKGLRESIEESMTKGYPVSEVIADKGCGGNKRFLKRNDIKNGIDESRNAPLKDPPVPKRRFVGMRNKAEGGIGIFKKVFIGHRLRAKTDFGDIKRVIKGSMGFNMKYAI